MLRLARKAGSALCFSGSVLLVLWACLALFFDLPVPWLRGPAAILYGLGSAAFFWFVRRPSLRLLGSLAGCGCVLLWWLPLKPSDRGPWQADISRTAWAEPGANRVVIHNFRSCDYRTEGDYTCQWLTRTVALDHIRGVDLFMDHWGTPQMNAWIAHTIFSFDLGGGEHIAFSVEPRKRVGQGYSAIRSFFRQFTLISVVSDERDLVRLRTNYRQGEDVYLYRVIATPAFSRALFLREIELVNQLHEHPEWYNAVTDNCTTEMNTLRRMKGQPWDWRILFDGKAGEMEYERGALTDGGLPWKELKRRAEINSAARAAGNDPDFSMLIRRGRPGFLQNGGD